MYHPTSGDNGDVDQYARRGRQHRRYLSRLHEGIRQGTPLQTSDQTGGIQHNGETPLLAQGIPDWEEAARSRLGSSLIMV